MNKEQFYNIISDSSLLTNVDEQSIDEIIKEFPYFQTAYVLKTKILSDKGSFKYDNFIKLASLIRLIEVNFIIICMIKLLIQKIL